MPPWLDTGVRDGVELTAYLVNESRARRRDLARDRVAKDWIPATERAAVRALWDDFAETVYPHDDLVVSLRGRFVLDTLSKSLVQHPDTVLVVCGAGFSSYPWLLPFSAALEVDLPDIVSAKRQRAAQLVATGVVEERDVQHLALDLGTAGGRRQLIEQARRLAAGRPVALVAEGLIFYLSPDAARATASLGAGLSAQTLTVLSYWPSAAADNRVLAAQRQWFRRRSVPEDSTYLPREEIASLLGGQVQDHGPEDLQREYLGEVLVPETELIPEYVAAAVA